MEWYSLKVLHVEYIFITYCSLEYLITFYMHKLLNISENIVKKSSNSKIWAIECGDITFYVKHGS